MPTTDQQVRRRVRRVGPTVLAATALATLATGCGSPNTGTPAPTSTASASSQPSSTTTPEETKWPLVSGSENPADTWARKIADNAGSHPAKTPTQGVTLPTGMTVASYSAGPGPFQVCVMDTATHSVAALYDGVGTATAAVAPAKADPIGAYTKSCLRLTQKLAEHVAPNS